MSWSTLTPVHILTGDLGSGKTTLLNEAMRAGLGPETAVVVNEFGEVGLDQLFIQARSEDTIVLRNGCVCCSIRSDLVATLTSLASFRPSHMPFRRILIETSGLSDPLPILNTIRSDPALRARFRTGSIVCTVGAIDGLSSESRLEALRQVTAADAIVITKRDLADNDLVVAIEGVTTALNPLAERLGRSGADLVRHLEQAESQMPLANWRPHTDTPPGVAIEKGGRIRSTVIRGATPVSWPRFAVWLSRLIFVHGDRVLRIKGVLFDSSRGTWIAVHGVRRFLYPPAHLELDRPPSFGAVLVFITENLDPARIERSYERLVASNKPSWR